MPVCLPLFLVGPDKLRLGEHMTPHGGLKLGFGRAPEVTQHGVQRIELVEVAMAADGRAGPAIAGALPVVQALLRADGQVAA